MDEQRDVHSEQVEGVSGCRLPPLASDVPLLWARRQTTGTCQTQDALSLAAGDLFDLLRDINLHIGFLSDYYIISNRLCREIVFTLIKSTWLRLLLFFLILREPELVIGSLSWLQGAWAGYREPELVFPLLSCRKLKTKEIYLSLFLFQHWQKQLKRHKTVNTGHPYCDRWSRIYPLFMTRLNGEGCFIQPR